MTELLMRTHEKGSKSAQTAESVKSSDDNRTARDHASYEHLSKISRRAGNQAIQRLFRGERSGQTASTSTGNTAQSTLPPELREGIESLSNVDLSSVRVHRNSPKPARIDALAYTEGSDIYVGPDQERYLPHEAWHVVQQLQGRVQPRRYEMGVSVNDDPKLEREADVMSTKAAQVTAKPGLHPLDGDLTEASKLTASVPERAREPVTRSNRIVQRKEPEETPDVPESRGREVQSYGIAYKKEGVNLRDAPSPSSSVLRHLSFNTRMYVDSEVDGYYFVGTEDGGFGYVATSHVKTNLPEPNAKIYWVEQGDTALEVSRKHYGGKAEWGRDHRFFVNGLVYVNRGEGTRGIYKPDPNADWDTTKLNAGYMIWIPSIEFMRSLQNVVKSGSITYEAWQTVKSAAEAVGEFLLGTGAFVVGLLHGALESIWDILVGLKDLLVMAKDLITWLIGLVTGDSKGLFESLSGLDWGELVQGWIDDFERKWNHENLLKKWHFRGWVIGYAIAEVVMLFLSGGVIQGIKWAGKASKVAKVISKIPKISKLGEAAKSSKLGKRLSKGLKSTKGASMSAKAARKFVYGLLQKPASIWGKGPDEIADAFRKMGYNVTVEQSGRGSKLSKQIYISNAPKGAPKITRIQVHPGGGRHVGSYYKISTSESSFGTKWVADRATFKPSKDMNLDKVVWVDSGLEGWLLRAATLNAAAQRGRREATQ